MPLRCQQILSTLLPRLKPKTAFGKQTVFRAVIPMERMTMAYVSLIISTTPPLLIQKALRITKRKSTTAGKSTRKDRGRSMATITTRSRRRNFT